MPDEPETESLTLIGKALPLDAGRRCFEGTLAGEPAIEGQGTQWDRITFRATHGTLELSALRNPPTTTSHPPDPAPPAGKKKKEGPASGPKTPFARLQGAMVAVAKIVRGANPKTQKKVIEQIEKAELLVRVAGTPQLTSVSGGLDVIGNLAQAMNAIVFTGEEFQDARGRTLLALPGDDDDD